MLDAAGQRPCRPNRRAEALAGFTLTIARSVNSRADPDDGAEQMAERLLRVGAVIVAAMAERRSVPE